MIVLWIIDGSMVLDGWLVVYDELMLNDDVLVVYQLEMMVKVVDQPSARSLFLK